jgi:hypothetical protein
VKNYIVEFAGILQLEIATLNEKQEIRQTLKLSSLESPCLLDNPASTKPLPVKVDFCTTKTSSTSSNLLPANANVSYLKESSILTERTAVDLMSFIPRSVSSTSLLYRGSRDGFTIDVYHSKCDNQGPHVIIVKCDKGYIFGGYVAVNIPTSTDNGVWVADPSNFLFFFL